MFGPKNALLHKLKKPRIQQSHMVVDNKTRHNRFEKASKLLHDFLQSRGGATRLRLEIKENRECL
jgi:hypothetical protein